MTKTLSRMNVITQNLTSENEIALSEMFMTAVWQKFL